jgi:hypothetical protein
MKSTIISMLIVLMVMVALPMIFLGDGDLARQLGFRGFGGSGGSGVKEAAPVKLPKNVKTVVTNKRVEVFTWTDEHGIKHFSNTPPSGGGAAEKIVLLPEDINTMEAVKIPEKVEAEGKEEEKGKEVKNASKQLGMRNPYTPGGMKELVGNSKDLQDTMAQRQVEQEKMMQDLFPRMNGDKR